MFVIMQHVINLDDEGVAEFCHVQKICFCLSIEILSNNLILISNKILKIQWGSKSLDINFIRGFIYSLYNFIVFSAKYLACSIF